MARGSHTVIRPTRSIRGAAATIALTSGISVVAPAVFGSVAHAATTQKMYATTDVNVRSASSNSGKVLTVAARGQSVKVTGEKVRGWVPVAVNGTTGWIYERFLTEEAVRPAHVDSSESVPHTMTATVAVNVRGAASNDGKVLTFAERGQQVKVTGRPDRGWVPVSVNGTSGWIYGRYLTTGKVAAAPAEPKNDAKKNSSASRDQHRPALDNAPIHTTTGINVRSTPSASGNLVSQLAAGTGVHATGNVHGNWVQINTNGHTGWAYRTYLTGKLPAPETTKPEKPKASSTSRDSARPPRQDANNGDSKGSGSVDGRCIASFYDEPQTTASGEQFNPNAMTAAHKSLPLGTRIRVTNVRNGRSTVVRINDRGPYVAGRCVDLSRASFAEIADTGQGTTPITYSVLS
ncbi:septal ring lytic transglycosylase RlpA family protein [Cutibacterium sp. WCA-380-WT-3A]|uniref:Probable endolytic peptidoglycan transglycosylase RlpA n=1 Tax=Cutibacterium porci TaxID=2605781 RepID=A0A7K0J3S5_9ACTN|nr:septal ring lytic transglycosylase RlpA family protein [Cutibacterium porci]MSS44576.1 septal ring lytic transglycosylase RlpA family protein [Cutibacterium porci]